jgi:phosphoribosylamine-glycine ligase
MEDTEKESQSVTLSFGDNNTGLGATTTTAKDTTDGTGLRILIVGSGGRDHALTSKLSKDKRVKKIYVSPGNGGIETTTKISCILKSVQTDPQDNFIEWAKIMDFNLVISEGQQYKFSGLSETFSQG